MLRLRSSVARLPASCGGTASIRYCRRDAVLAAAYEHHTDSRPITSKCSTSDACIHTDHAHNEICI